MLINTRTIERFKDAPFVGTESENITIVGAGGTGSWLALFLSRHQHKLDIWDRDSYELVNMGGQAMLESYVGMNKAIAAKRLIKEFSPDTTVVAHHEHFTENSHINPITFCCPDSMSTRELVFEKWHGLGDKRELFIEARLLAEEGTIYAVTQGNESRYLATLFPDGEGHTPMCTFKQTTHSAALIGSLMVAIFSNYMANKLTGDVVRAIPFKSEFMLPLMMFNYEY